MPQWAGSCWYYLRYLDSRNDQAPWDPAKERYWMPVDLYVGGAEHAVLHLLYARFWHKVLFDLGLVSTSEPFLRLVNQGMILGISYRDARGALVPNDKVESRAEEFPAKMSKSLKNVVNPDEIIAKYGADSFRLYEMFMGPLEAVKPWRTEGVDGVYRFLHRAWKMIIGPDGAVSPAVNDTPLTRDQLRLLHQTIKKVGEDVDGLAFNTAISQLMIFVNEFGRAENRNRQAMETFVLLLAPLAPHLAEELWECLGHTRTLAYEPWPAYDEACLKVDEIEVLVQVNGKPAARMMMPAAAAPEQMVQLALGNDSVQRVLKGRSVAKAIGVPGRLVNIVAR
jgi:leucyl-tRNA synthetase